MTPGQPARGTRVVPNPADAARRPGDELPQASGSGAAWEPSSLSLGASEMKPPCTIDSCEFFRLQSL